MEKNFNKVRNYFFRKKTRNIISIETNFPKKIPSGFTNAGINFLLNSDLKFTSYTPSLRKRNGFCDSIGISSEDFKLNKEGYLKYYKRLSDENFSKKIKFLENDKKIKADLAHTTHLSQAYVLRPFFSRNKIPFVFSLCPGGGFGLNNYASDYCLRDIFSDRFFRKVIVNNEVSYDYLLRKRLCKESKIEFLLGSNLQFQSSEIDINNKRFYKKDKNTFDICFVAYRYDEKGESKGYDLFIKTAFKLCEFINTNEIDIRFHVVGNFNENTINVERIKKRISFHGPRDPKWLYSFYFDMDISIAPVRPFLLYEGSFDGYPMGREASLFSVAIFSTDELNQNRNYKYYKYDEVVNINLNENDIFSKVLNYLTNTDKLYDLAEKGRQKTIQLCDLNKRMNNFINILNNSF